MFRKANITLLSLTISGAIVITIYKELLLLVKF